MTTETTETPAKLDEVSLRRPDFVGGNPIELATGDVLYFPRPCIEFSPRFGEGESLSVGVATSLGPEFDALVLALDGDPDVPRSGTDLIDAMLRLAVWMVRRNYAISNDDLARVLVLRVGDERSQETWRAITATARGTSGNGPGPDTSGS